jgi:hypothetical protein
LVGVVVNSTDVPEQIDPEGEAAIITLAGRLGFTVICLVKNTPSHVPPLAVSVKTTVGPEVTDAVYVAVFGALPSLFANEPPAPPSDHKADVADPPKDPPKATVVPP